MGKLYNYERISDRGNDHMRHEKGRLLVVWNYRFIC